MKGAYSEYLQSDEWSIRRERRIALSDGECEACHDERRLQIHHLTYERVSMESMDDLMTLCADCHALAEAAIAKGIIARSGDVLELRSSTLAYIHSQSLMAKPVKKSIPSSSTPTITLTGKHIAAAMGLSGALSDAQMNLLGVRSPVQKGWLKNLVGKTVKVSTFRQVLRIKEQRDTKVSKRAKKPKVKAPAMEPDELPEILTWFPGG